MKPFLTTALLLAALLCCASPSAAQDFDDPIATSRPGFASGTATVAPGRVQIEIGTPGVSLTTRDRSGLLIDPNGDAVRGNFSVERRTINFPTLLRVGVLPWLEVRASSPVYNLRRDTFSGTLSDGTALHLEAKDEGTGRINVGVKARFLQSDGLVPSLSLAPLLTLPVGGAPFTSNEGVGYAATLAAGWALPVRLGANLDAGLTLTPVDGTDDFVANSTFVGALSRPFTQQTSGYVEGAFVLHDGEDEAGYLGAGATYLIVPTAQLDAFFDRGLNGNATDWRFGGGVSIRFGD